MRENGLGLVHIYTGEGKGKTSAAVGLAVRARGAGLRVAFFQFMKGGESGEVGELRKHGATVEQCGEKPKFVFQMKNGERETYRETQTALFRRAIAAAGETDVLVLDELGSAVSTGMIPEEEVLEFLDKRPAGVEVVLTGRGFGERVLERADYVSEIVCVRHPYQRGIKARRGIEF